MSARRIALLLWILLALFVCRVVGQLVVVLYAPSFLPPMEEWYSGLMPYPYLLPTQILIIVLFSRIALDITCGTGFWAHPKPTLGIWLRNFGIVYFLSMVVRYALRMSWYPEERWFGGTIPIIFHWVLAAYIIVLGCYHLHASKTGEDQAKQKVALSS
jgi:uncharacterized protein